MPLGYLVRVKGVEPPRLAALDPKSSVSTNSTTPAFVCCNAFEKAVCKFIQFYQIEKLKNNFLLPLQLYFL